MALNEAVVVLHSGSSLKSDKDLFTEVIVEQINIGPFVYQKGIYAIVKKLKPRTILATFDLKVIKNMMCL